MSLLPVLIDARNAYEAHDRDAFERALARMQQMLARITPICHLDPCALERRRTEVASELAAIDAEAERRRNPAP